MRKITNEAARALLNSRSFKRDNTEVIPSGLPRERKLTVMKLHGNVIATRIDRRITVTLGGHSNSLIRERLNGLLTVAAGGMQWNHRCEFVQENGE